MPLGGRDLHSLTYDLAENRAAKCAGLYYVILFHSIVINASLWRSKRTVAACSALPSHSTQAPLACLPGRDPTVPPLPTFCCEKLLLIQRMY